jgi:hypothetical protein
MSHELKLQHVTLEAMSFIVIRSTMQGLPLEKAAEPYIKTHSCGREARSKLALFIALLRGHTIDRAETREMDGTFYAACTCCDMAIKVREHPIPGAPGIEGRATELRCPSNRSGGGHLR